MTVRLYLAPAAFGKTTYALNCVHNAAQGLQPTPRVVVPSHLQVRAWYTCACLGTKDSDTYQ